MNILLSTTYSGILDIHTGSYGGHSVDVKSRASDWGKTGAAKYIHHTGQALKILIQARRYDVLVLCNVCIEAFIVAGLRGLLCPRTRIVCYDFLMPNENRVVYLIRAWLKCIDRFACIRSGDIPALSRRFGIPAANCSFVPFPTNLPADCLPAVEEDYIYSAGWAHRDWPTLIEALSTLPYSCVLSAGVPLLVPQEAQTRIKTLPAQSPEAGRHLMAKARLVVLSFQDTDLPSGPLVLLDALAMGKAVVATDVNGTRDYVVDGSTALLVLPSNPHAMANTIRSVMENSDLRVSLGKEAQRDVAERFTLNHTLTGILQVCQRMD